MAEITVPDELVQYAQQQLGLDDDEKTVIAALHLANELNNPKEMLQGVPMHQDVSGRERVHIEVEGDAAD